MKNMMKLVTMIIVVASVILIGACSKGPKAPKGFVFVKGRSADLRIEGNTDIKDFYIAESEVTQALYESVMGYNPSWFEGELRPVEQVEWHDAVEFCNMLSEREGLQKCYSGSGKNIICDFRKNGYRLPTKAEWMYAAEGGDKSKGYEYFGSGNIDEVAWYKDNSGDETHPVKTKKPNELGLYDMSGNVWEWCWDSYLDRDPSLYRIHCGGGWNYPAEGCSVSYYRVWETFSRLDTLGFRLARSAQK